MNALTATREVIRVDLPGFGTTPPLPGEVSTRTLCDALTEFVRVNGLTGIDAVGSSMGARLVLELARRGGVVGNVVALDPGGFWRGWQRHAFYASIYLSIRLLRVLRSQLHSIVASDVGRTALLWQFSARPWALPPDLVTDELRNYVASPSFDACLRELAYGEQQAGAPAGTLRHRVTLGWGRRDRICFRTQAQTALRLFPDARPHWFERSGHFPHWDEPDETVRLILESTGPERAAPSRASERCVAPAVEPRAQPPLPTRPRSGRIAAYPDAGMSAVGSETGSHWSGASPF